MVMTKFNKLIRITSIYGEEFYRVEITRSKNGIYTDKGFIPFSDIAYIDIIGDIKVYENNKK